MQFRDLYQGQPMSYKENVLTPLLSLHPQYIFSSFFFQFDWTRWSSFILCLCTDVLYKSALKIIAHQFLQIVLTTVIAKRTLEMESGNLPLHSSILTIAKLITPCGKYFLDLLKTWRMLYVLNAKLFRIIWKYDSLKYQESKHFKLQLEPWLWFLLVYSSLL